MYARVFLLLLVTGLFMAAWNTDRTAEQEFLAWQAWRQSEIADAGERTELGVRAARRSSRDPRLIVHLPSTAEPASQAVSQFRPKMASGNYRAISETGVTFELTVGSSSNGVPRDFYIADSPDGIRWYFVRIQSANQDLHRN